MFLTGFFTLLAMLLFGNGALDRRHYPHIPIASDHDRILIVAPHIDDESIAAAGYATDAIARGADVYVVFLTAGDCNRFTARILQKRLDPNTSAYLAVGRMRIAEATRAMELLGVPQRQFFVLGYPDRGLGAIVHDPTAVVRSRGTGKSSVPYPEALSPGSPYRLASVVEDMERVIRMARPSRIIVPVSFDLHPDHRAAATITDMALENVGTTPERLGYLVHTGRLSKSLVWLPHRRQLPPPRLRRFTWGVYPLATSLQQRKDAILRTYRSQKPYVFLLRNQFVRSNELFFIFGEEPSAVASNGRGEVAR